ncbi:unnamed protein product [Arctia plantaginis]|uniref:Centriolar coiled-coil protein of 110 kDa n=1 Tax=Arctia plantaginis TaxID=874455 RepID=A0A8S0Z574_ARCPL|nr:unnamed protein product [Arctia plantaginis]
MRLVAGATMNDPWDVKAVRQPGQYLSCMKINGVPLLPPVLSKECRKEMQYYKVLAKEVEKRIAHLKQYVYDTSSDSEDKTDAPELSECEQSYDLAEEEIQAGFNVNIGSIKAVTTGTEMSSELATRNGKDATKRGEKFGSNAPKFFIDLNLTINEAGSKILETVQKAESPPALEVPERDYNCVSRFTQQVITEKEVVTTVETCRNIEKKSIGDNFDFCDNKDESLSDPLTEIPLSPDGPSSLSSKRFTGSLDNLHSEITKDSLKNNSKLVRQRSYTLLYPSPQLLAHLETHSQNTGIEMSSISMSESLSNISSPGKKRRSWDLESAKVKWSNMALELKQKSVAHVISTVTKNTPKSETKQKIPLRAKSIDPAVAKRNNTIARVLPKSEPIAKNKTLIVAKNHVNSRSLDQQVSSPKSKIERSLKMPTTPVSEVADPAARVRELYEKIQKQQLVQMENLVEKQKKEQLLLQQVFEEQNNMLFKQLKTICPKSPVEAKEAWSDKQYEEDRGPVSLSQLMNYKSATLTDTNQYLNHCEDVLKKSKNITGNLKKVLATAHSTNASKIQSPTKQLEGSRTRTHSPVRNPTSRRLNYDTSASSDRDYEAMLTDRTNDTMADLNVTFPSDNSDEGNNNNNLLSHLCSKVTKSSNGSSVHTNSVVHSRVTEKTIKNVGRSVNSSMQNSSARTSKIASYKHVPNPREREAATKIVAHAKGYLVRRLMRTERVQGIVQTIKDALLCALQLHQDREGIRGADVDLHRRLIQQITAACYSLHDTFVASTAAERCAMIAADRGRRNSLAARQPISFRQTDIMTQSHSGSFPARTKRQPSLLMTQSNYDLAGKSALRGEPAAPPVALTLAAARVLPAVLCPLLGNAQRHWIVKLFKAYWLKVAPN